MRRAPITREDLPYLEVESIVDGPLVHAADELTEFPSWKIRGRVSDPRIVDPKGWCTFLGRDRNCLTGDWLSEADEDGTAEFHTCNPPESLASGSRITFAGQLYGRIAILVEDGPSAWDAHVFHSRNAVATHFVDAEGQGWRTLRPLKEGERPGPDDELVKKGWDHEHCAICNEHINPGDSFFQHRSESEYLCVKCFEKHVPSGDLSFLIPVDSEVTANGDP